MPRFPNGQIPESALVVFNRGWNQTDGAWFWGLPAATYAKHLRLLALARKRGRGELQITDGWGTYRPLAAQVVARRIYGNGAAWPGTSSHGGFWEGQDTAAIDYGNWAHVYDEDRAAFFADVRAAGLAPGLIHPSRNPTYPDEPWHVVDLDPWGAIPAADSANPFEEDDMSAADVAEIKAHIDQYLQVPGQAYGYPQAILNDQQAHFTQIISGQIYFPGAQYLMATALASQGAAVLAAVQQGASGTGSTVDIAKLFADMETRLRADFQGAFDEFAVQIKAETLDAVGKIDVTAGASVDQVRAAASDAIDSALKRIGVQITVAPS